MASSSSQAATAEGGAGGAGGTTKPPLRGVIFDMDGTLTIPNLDFSEMYRRCGVNRKDDILAAIAKMDSVDAERANAIVEEMEEEGRRTLQLMPGAVALLQWLAHYNIPMALVTRNTFRSTQRLQELIHHQQANPSFSEAIFAPIVARDTQPIQPPKPDTAALHYIASQWKVELSRQFVMVGDSPYNDIQFGKNAGIATALLWQREEDKFHDENQQGGADILVSHLSQLPRRLLENYQVVMPQQSLQRGDPATPPQPPQPTTTAAKAAHAGDLEALKSLPVEALLAKDECHNTPLIWASEAGHEAVVMYLLDVISSSSPNNIDSSVAVQSTQLDTRGYQGNTAVSRAARRGHLQVLDRLLQHSTSITIISNPTNIPNVKLQYPLHIAAFRQHASIVKRLLEAGADPHVVDQKGRTPLEDTSCAEIQDLLQSAMTTTTMMMTEK